MRIFKSLVIDPNLEWEFIDGSIVKAHQHSAGAAGGEEQAIGKSVAGNTTKIHMAVATRYDKLKRNYSSMVAMTCGFIWLPM